MKKLFTLLGIITITLQSFAQISVEQAYNKNNPNHPIWVQLMYAENPDVDLVIKAYESYYAQNPFVKNGHTQYFKRWLRELSRDLDGSTNPLNSSEDIQNLRLNNLQYQERIQNRNTNKHATPLSSWTGLGPFDWDHGAASRSYAPGAAHVYTVEQAASDPNILYAGTATAGLWKSTDMGANWSLMTSSYLTNQVYAIEINPQNANTVYAVINNGIYKSINGGQNWTETGDAGFQSTDITARDIKISPTDTNMVWLAAEQGLYVTTDGGANWTQKISDVSQEIEFHPSNGNIIYVITEVGNQTQFHRSVDNGANFVQQTTGWPTPISPDENKRAEIAVSLAAPDKVFALLTGRVNGGSGLYGIYVSADSGSSWAFNCCGPQPGGPASTSNINMMGWDKEGEDNGGQYYYDLGMAVSPTNADSIFVGGVNMWVSGDGGNTFICPSKWSEPGLPSYVHADIHDINYYSNGQLWVANDGGIFFSSDNGATFTRKIFGIEGTDFWGFDAGFWDGEVMLGGAYHNGTLLKNGSVYLNDWICTDGGDGTGGFVNFAKAKTAYSDFNIKELVADRTTPIQTRSYYQKPTTHYITGRLGKIEFHPNLSEFYYFGFDTCLWKTEDDNYSAEEVYCFGELVSDIEVAPSNPDVIYVSTFRTYWGGKKVYKSTDGGQNFVEITPSTAVFSATRWIPYDLEVDENDADKVWLARVANSATDYDGEKIYLSTDGGTSWVNRTTSTLDGENLTNIVYQRGSLGGVYVGSRRAVYYRNDTMSDWVLFNQDLPASTFSTKLVPHYRSGKIRNATNRSVYEATFYEPSSTSARIAVNKKESACARDTFQFYDYSVITDQNAQWDWDFPDGVWVDDTTSRTPKAVFNAVGTYTVGLDIQDDNGTASTSLNNFITVSAGCEVDTIPGSSLQLSAGGDYVYGSNLGIRTNEFTLTAWIKPNGTQNQYTGIFINDGVTTGLNFQNNNELGYHWPGGQWWWNSGLFATDGEWSYVALVASPSQMRIYVNGEESVQNISLDSVDLGAFKIGSYKAWNTRNFKGLIDEVCIWNRSLTKEEIRNWRHLTKEHLTDENHAQYDPRFLAYYQFNESSGDVLDRSQTHHLITSGGAARSTSTAPVSAGFFHEASVTAGGTVSFGDTDLELEFPASGTYPNGELVAFKLNTSPDQDAALNAMTDNYWVVNNYGTNQTFDELESIKFLNRTDVNNNCFSYSLYKRNSNKEANSWGNAIDSSDQCLSGANGSITFSSGNGITSFSQLQLADEGDTPLPVELLYFEANIHEWDKVKLDWATAVEINNKHFEVERSTDGMQYQHIGLVLTQNGNSSQTQYYSFIDSMPVSGTNYYRLKQVDEDNSFEYSPIEDILINSLANEFSISPTVVKDGDFITIYTYADNFHYRLYSAKGKVVDEKTEQDGKHWQMPQLAVGYYFYKVEIDRKIYSGKLFVVE